MGNRILVIDKDIDLLGIMKTVLSYVGFEVLLSPAADDYQNLISRHKVNLIIIDYQLWDANGGEICYQIKGCPEFKHLPVIVLSDYPMDLQSPASYVCDAFLPKPFDLKDMVNQISKLLHN